jgi:hypothetical protein
MPALPDGPRPLCAPPLPTGVPPCSLWATPELPLLAVPPPAFSEPAAFGSREDELHAVASTMASSEW